MEIPKTKDEKHDLVFTENILSGSGGHVNRSVAGRLAYELFRIGDQNPKKIQELYKKYGNISNYDVAKDPEQLFEDVTIPVIGTPDIDTALIKNISSEKYAIVNRLIAPYSKFTESQRCFNGIFNTDHINSLTNFSGEELSPTREAFRDKRIAIFDNCNVYDLSTFLDPEWREPMKIWARGLCQGIRKEYARDGECFNFRNRVKMTNEQKGFARPCNDYETINGFMPVIDLKLSHTLADSVVAICDEYLSEMK